MNALIWFFFGWSIVSAVAKAACVASYDYPKHTIKTFGEDVLSLILQLFLLVWISIVLFM